MNTHDDDTDPTGMRALLRGLPDPGPMPDDLADARYYEPTPHGHEAQISERLAAIRSLLGRAD